MVRTYSQWDHFGLRWAGSDATLASHLKERTKGFERFDQLPDAERDGLKADFDVRVNYWQQKTAAESHFGFDATLLSGLFLLFLTLAIAGTSGPLVHLIVNLAGGDGRAPIWLRALLVAFWVALTAIVARFVILKVLQSRRIKRCLRTGSCPDCGYDLAGSPPAIEPTQFDHRSVGPLKCPECGSPWPLLPPPVFDPTFKHTE